MIHARNPSFLGTQYTKIKSARKICTRTVKQALISAFLFNQHLGCVNETVNKAGVIQHYSVFKTDVLTRIRNIIDSLQQVQLEGLTILSFITTILPTLDKGRGGSFLICFLHETASIRQYYVSSITHQSYKEKRQSRSSEN